MLVAKGADPKMLSDDRDTTLPKLTAGSPVAPVSRGGLSALSFAARQGQIDSAKALIDAGANVNQKDVDGNSALVLALLNKHYDLAKVLIDRGADVNAANKDGRAPLFTAIEIRNEEYSPRPALKDDDKLSAMDIIKTLLDKGAKVNAQLTNSVPIHKFAQDMGDKTMGEGATPFLRAARGADVETMRLLLAKGADPKLGNKDGLTALLVALFGYTLAATYAVKLIPLYGGYEGRTSLAELTMLYGYRLRMLSANMDTVALAPAALIYALTTLAILLVVAQQIVLIVDIFARRHDVASTESHR